jgi:hypothetical protein
MSACQPDTVALHVRRQDLHVTCRQQKSALLASVLRVIIRAAAAPFMCAVHATPVSSTWSRSRQHGNQTGSMCWLVHTAA